MPEGEATGLPPAAMPEGGIAPVAARSGPVAYLQRLWRGELPLGRVFWTDMVIAGSLVNLGMSLVAILLFAAGLPVAVGVTVHFSPLPYNILLLLAVWRSAEREASGWSLAAQAGAVAWFLGSLLL